MEERQNQGGNLNPVVNEEPMMEDLSEELERKFYELDEVAKGKGEEETVQIRMHQLAIAKVLVFAYNKNDFQLVKAHAELGWAYLNFKCYEQSIDHLTISLKKNSKLNESREAKEYNHRILKWLGKCYLEAGSIEDAIEILHNAYNDVKAVKGEQDIECAEIQTILSNCYRKSKDFKSALECLDEVKFIADSNNMSESERVVQVHVERAQVFMDEESYPEAIQSQMEALRLLDKIKSDKHEYRAELLNTLSIMQEKTENFAESLDTLVQIRDLYTKLYGEADKRTLKIKRHLALSLLRAERNEEALQELLQTEEIETGIFGEDSVQVAKTQKIIGTLFLVTKEYADALKYLNKALRIFHENGAKNMVAEIRKKIQMIKDIQR